MGQGCGAEVCGMTGWAAHAAVVANFLFALLALNLKGGVASPFLAGGRTGTVMNAAPCALPCALASSCGRQWNCAFGRAQDIFPPVMHRQRSSEASSCHLPPRIAERADSGGTLPSCRHSAVY